MIVVDASVVVAALVDGPARTNARAIMSAHDLIAPDVVDVEVASALRGLWLSKQLTDQMVTEVSSAALRLPIDRHPSTYLVPRAVELRANVSAYDAVYVALAEAFGCTLATCDLRLAAASGPRCAFTTVVASRPSDGT